MNRFSLFDRLLRFRNELVLLWRAFWLESTPLYLKAAMIGVIVYLVSPVDLIPDVIPIIGWIDDIVLIPLVVSWIVSKLPSNASNDDGGRSARTIDGTARRI